MERTQINSFSRKWNTNKLYLSDQEAMEIQLQNVPQHVEHWDGSN